MKGAVKFRQCGSKIRYRDEHEANRVIKRRLREGAAYLRAYECGLCNGGFHLTKSRVNND